MEENLIRTWTSFESRTDEVRLSERGMRFHPVVILPRRSYWLLVEQLAPGRTVPKLHDTHLCASFYQVRAAFNAAALKDCRIYLVCSPFNRYEATEHLVSRVREIYSRPDDRGLIYVSTSGSSFFTDFDGGEPWSLLTQMIRVFPAPEVAETHAVKTA